MNKIKVIRDEINKIISDGDFKNGKLLIDEYKNCFGNDDEIASMEAIVNFYQENYEQALINIREGLKINIFNSDLYSIMGNIYQALGEYNRAYLCYEQALYLCQDEANKGEIENSITNLKKNYKIDVNNISFVLLTYNQLDYTKLCIDSIRKNNYKNSYQIIIVDNNSTDGTVEWIKAQEDIKVVYNNDNKGFPKGCNQGIEISEKNNDIMLLNNDTVLMPNSIFDLRMGLYSNEKVGAVGSVSNSVSNGQMISEAFNDFDGYINYAIKNNISDEASYEERVKLVGFAMLFKRNVLDRVGLLDEIFTPGNFEDDDISLRVVLAGYKILLCKDSYIHHFGSVSFRNVKGGYSELLTRNNQKFKKKWGFSAYDAERFYKGILQFIDKEDANILEINAGGGSNLVTIRNELNDRNYYAYETNKKLRKMNEILNLNVIEDLNNDKYNGFFNLVIINEFDVINNNKLMNVIKKLLNLENGKVIIVLDAYKEDRYSFSKEEVIKFVCKFSSFGFEMKKNTTIDNNNGISLCILVFDNLTDNKVFEIASEMLDKGEICKANNYFTLLNNYEINIDLKSVKEKLKDRFKILNQIKFLLRRIELKNDEEAKKVFDYIEQKNICDQSIIELVKENIINKVYILNFIAIEYFEREQYDRVIPYLQEALNINSEDLDTIYNIAFVLNCFGQKEKALDYLKNVNEKNEDINKLISEIKGE